MESALSLSLRTSPLSETRLLPSPKATEWKLSSSRLTSLWTRPPATPSKKPWRAKISASWWTVWSPGLPLRAWWKYPSRACWIWWIGTSRSPLWWPGWCCRACWSAAEALWSTSHRGLAPDRCLEEWPSLPPPWDPTPTRSASRRSSRDLFHRVRFFIGYKRPFVNKYSQKCLLMLVFLSRENFLFLKLSPAKLWGYCGWHEQSKLHPWLLFISVVYLSSAHPVIIHIIIITTHISVPTMILFPISGLHGSFLQSSSPRVQRQRDLCPKPDSFPGRRRLM